MSYRFSRVSFLRAVLIFVVVLLSSLQKERQFVTADVRLRHGEHIKVLARVENPDLNYVRVDDIDEEYLNETMKRDDDDGELDSKRVRGNYNSVSRNSLTASKKENNVSFSNSSSSGRWTKRMAAKNEFSDVDYVDDTRLFLVTLVGESSYALSTPRVWRDLDIALRKHKGALLRPIPDQSFLAFGPPLAAAVAERYQVGASHWVINKWPKETVSSFAFESVCAKTMCEWFDSIVAPAPFFDTKGKNTREDNFLFAQLVAKELDNVMKVRNASSSSYCRASDIDGVKVQCTFGREVVVGERKKIFSNIMGHNAVVYIHETLPIVTHNYNTQSLVQGGVHAGQQLASINRCPLWKLGLSGNNQVVAMTDTGIDKYNCYFSDVKTPNANATTFSKIIDIRSLSDSQDMVDFTTGHGTRVAGVFFGSSGSFYWNKQYDGVAKNARVAFTDIGYVNRTDDSDVLVSLSNVSRTLLYEYPSVNFSAHVQSNSWGIRNSYSYETSEYEVDLFLNENQENVIVFSAGNDGIIKPRNSITRPANAKNVISVGGTKSVKSASPTQSLYTQIKIELGDGYEHWAHANVRGMSSVNKNYSSTDTYRVITVASPENGCATLPTASDSNQIVLLKSDVASCSHAERLKNAETAGYYGALVYANETRARLTSMVDDQTQSIFLSAFISMKDGLLLRALIEKGDLSANDAFPALAIKTTILVASSENQYEHA